MTPTITPADLAQLLARVTEVTDNHTGRGTCYSCGECCSRFLPMTRVEAMGIRAYAAANGIAPRPECADYDLMCPWLDLGTRTCMVYEVRPQICRVYRCDLHKAGRLPIDALPGAEPMDMREVINHAAA